MKSKTSSNQSRVILLVGGGTGWHVFPLLNLFQYIQKNTIASSENFSEISFRWVGESNSIESRLAGTHEIPFSAIICGKLRRYFSLKTFLVPFQILIGTVQSVVIILDEKPSAIFSKGGYVSLPVAIAGWLLRVPVYLHESDSVPGLANRLVACFATGIFITFPEANSYFEAKKIKWYGMLLSPDIQKILSKPVKHFTKTQLLINCGSQGSSRVFDTLLEMLRNGESALETIDVHLVLGTKNADYRTQFEWFPSVRIYDFFYSQKEYLELVHDCDIVITRSSSSIFEFEALWLHMILVPLPESGNNHQYHNAKIFEKKGHECILQENLTKELPWVLGKYENYKKSANMSPINLSIYEQITQKLMQ